MTEDQKATAVLRGLANEPYDMQCATCLSRQGIFERDLPIADYCKKWDLPIDREFKMRCTVCKEMWAWFPEEDYGWVFLGSRPR